MAYIDALNNAVIYADELIIYAKNGLTNKTFFEHFICRRPTGQWEVKPNPWKIKPKSVVRACLDFGFLEEWILFGF